MAKNNELALAFNFKDAPEELKKLAEVYKANFKRLDTAKLQQTLWQNELIEAERLYVESGKQFKKALDAWEPEVKETKPELQRFKV